MSLSWLASVTKKLLPQQVLTNVNAIRDGSGCKTTPSSSFSIVASTNVGMSSQNFLNFSLNPLVALM